MVPGTLGGGDALTLSSNMALVCMVTSSSRVGLSPRGAGLSSRAFSRRTREMAAMPALMEASSGPGGEGVSVLRWPTVRRTRPPGLRTGEALPGLKTTPKYSASFPCPSWPAAAGAPPPVGQMSAARPLPLLWPLVDWSLSSCAGVALIGRGPAASSVVLFRRTSSGHWTPTSGTGHASAVVLREPSVAPKTNTSALAIPIILRATPGLA